MMYRVQGLGVLGLVLWSAGCGAPEGIEAPEGRVVEGDAGRGARVEGVVPPPGDLGDSCTEIVSRIVTAEALGAAPSITASAFDKTSLRTDLTFELTECTKPLSGDEIGVMLLPNTDNDGAPARQGCCFSWAKTLCADSGDDPAEPKCGDELDAFVASCDDTFEHCYVMKYSKSTDSTASLLSDLRDKFDGSGALAAGWDCDDGDGSRSPAKPEICDSSNVDEDCDESADDLDSPDPTAFDATKLESVWAEDKDNDTFGDLVDEFGDLVDEITYQCDSPDITTYIKLTESVQYSISGESIAFDTVNYDDCDDRFGAGKPVNPTATETCNSVDDDCDGAIDDADTDTSGEPTGKSSFYLDDDEDSYGDPSVTIQLCEESAEEDETDTPSGSRHVYQVYEDPHTGVHYVDNDEDCKDDVPSINPGALEVCSADGDHVDENCNDVFDADDGLTVYTWYPDTDGDGQGDAGDGGTESCADLSAGCDMPTGACYVAGDNNDCDDTEGRIYKSSDPTDSSDFPYRDTNCDGVVTDCDLDGDSFDCDPEDSSSPCYQKDCLVASGEELDCDDDCADCHPGGAEVCNSDDRDEDCDGLVDSADSDDVHFTDYYPDRDGDTYGDENATDIDIQSDCENPSESSSVTYVTDHTDCDDGVGDINPGETEIYYNGLDEDCSDETPDCDQDNDGQPCAGSTEGSGCYEADESVRFCNGMDCDDGDVDRYYGAPEDPGGPTGAVAYSGVDYDCNGVVCDHDADGYPCDPAEYISTCDPTICGIGTGTDVDCNDESTDVTPGMEEVWYDGVDQNCDDNDCDQDNDGHDCDASVTAECAGCLHSTTKPWDDCDDTNASISPALPEQCYPPGIDENCNGEFDENLSDSTSCGDLDDVGPGYRTLYLDDDMDGFGDPNHPGCVCPYYTSSTECPSEPVAGVATSGGCYTEDVQDCRDGQAGDGDYHPPYDGYAHEEVLDGHSKDCDLYLPVVEADCDEDVYLALSNAEVLGTAVTEVDQLAEAPYDCRLLFGDAEADASGFTPVSCIGFDDWDVSNATEQLLAAYCRDQWDDVGYTLTCWDEEFVVACSRETGLLGIQLYDKWDATGETKGLVTSSSAVDRLFRSGKRISGLPAGTGDCDDTCPDRNLGVSEECDGLDNDCSGFAYVDTNNNGLPCSLDGEEVDERTGTVAEEEADLDQDEYLSCNEGDAISGDQTYEAPGNCEGDVTAAFGDCGAQCALSRPSWGPERCDGFQNNCDATNPDALGDDADPKTDGAGDGFMFCGSGVADKYSDDLTDEIEGDDVYVLVYVPASEVTGSGAATSRHRPGRVAADTASHTGDTALSPGDTATHTGDTALSPRDTAAHTGDTSAPADSADTGLPSAEPSLDLSNLVPLIVPRGYPYIAGGDLYVARTCDQPLFDRQLAALLAAAEGPSASSDLAVVEDQLREAMKRADAAAEDMILADHDVAKKDGFGLRPDEDPLLQLCFRTSEAHKQAQAGHATCAVMRLSLLDPSEIADPEGYDGCTTSSPADQAEAVPATVWSRARILESRRRVIEWECYRLWGTFGCTGETPPGSWKAPADDGAVARDGFYVPALDLQELADFSGADTWQGPDLVDWWLELGRFGAVPVTGLLSDPASYETTYEDGSLAGCWGDVAPSSSDLTGLSSKVGGDCRTDLPDANRDHWEGPDDPIALYWGQTPDCGICEDGVDNNCDGVEDEADPSCYRCYAGMGCGSASSSEKDAGGCAVADATERRRLGTSALLGALVGFGALLTRRKRA